jgi:hypothetical protein
MKLSTATKRRIHIAVVGNNPYAVYWIPQFLGKGVS